MPAPVKRKTPRHEGNGQVCMPLLASPQSPAEKREHLTDECLIPTIEQDIAAVGLVGERDKGLLLYLAYSSRKLDDPLSVIVRGPSGSGKDEIQRKPAKLMPPEEVIEVTSLTANALYYNEQGWLEHKVLLGGERSHREDPEQRDKTAALRQMLSQKYIVKVTVDDLKTKRIQQNGPVVYTETTTMDSIFKEDSNRCFQVNTDDSPELTRAVKQSVAGRFEDADTGAGGLEKIIEWHQGLQRALEPVGVQIPFARKLAEGMPDGRIEVRRTITQVLALVEVITYLHQHWRERAGDGRLIATAYDYSIARRLLVEPLHAVIGLGSKKFKTYAELMKQLTRKEFDSNQALKLFANKVSRDRALKSLAQLGILKCTRKGKSHQPARWRRTGKSLDEMVLPSMDFITS